MCTGQISMTRCTPGIPISFFQSSEPHGEETVVDDVTVLIMEEFLLLCEALQGLARGAQSWQTVFPHDKHFILYAAQVTKYFSIHQKKSRLFPDFVAFKGAMDISRGTDRHIGATFLGSREAHESEPFTKTSKTLAVMQGLLHNCQHIVKQLSAIRPTIVSHSANNCQPFG